MADETMRKNAAVIATVAVIVGTGEGRENRFEWLRAHGSYRFGESREVGNAKHADVTAAPRLRRQPIN